MFSPPSKTPFWKEIGFKNLFRGLDCSPALETVRLETDFQPQWLFQTEFGKEGRG
jgi:hypothetical protein